uniref:Fc mu receptor n=1 Tax=Rhinolophus ferrumequinum TaxID=59479 RepID=A0A671FVN2_RHIFE
MDIWLWSLYFLPVSGALKILPEVKLEGMLGGSITIKCPLPETPRRLYLCREIDKPRSCVTVISNTNFVRMDYKDRVTLKPCPDQNLFLVEVKELTKSDSGVYACGAGRNTGWGKTQQVTLNVHSVSTPAQKTAVPSAHHSSPTTPITHRPRVSRSSPVVSAKPTTLLPSTTTSKTSAPEEPLRPQTASYNHQTKPYRQRAFNHVPASRMEDQGFHILIPTILGLILLALLGLVAKRVIQRRKALSRQVRRLAVRMSALEASQRPPSQRPRVSQRSRSQNNVYSACPRRSGWAQAAGEGEAPVPSSEASAPPAPPQVSEAPWPHALSLKTSCEYMSFYHKPVANMEDTDSDYVNIPCPTHPSNCLPGPRPWCQ